MEARDYEKSTTDHHDSALPVLDDTDSPTGSDVYVNDASGAKQRWFTPWLVGSALGQGLGLVNGTGVFALVGPVLGIVNADIGPSPNYYWINLSYNLVLAVGFLLFGRITDIFGRRYFVIGANLLALIGTIVASRAQSINTVIGGTVLLTLGAVPQGSFTFVLAELIPLKHRFALSGTMYWFTVPANAFGPLISYAFVLHTKAGWRWIYYLLSITNGLALLCSILFYFPPTFGMKNVKSRRQVLRDFDWVGLVLFTGGLTIFLIGLSWGGATYPWTSGRVLGTIITGGVTSISFVLYETFMPLKEPLMPMHLFKNLPWVATMIPPCLVVGCNYGFAAIIWPQMIAIYTSDKQYTAELACATGASFICGSILGGLAGKIGKQKAQIIVAAAVGAALCGGVACATVENKSTLLGLLIPGFVALGYADSVALNCNTIILENQDEIGAAFGVASTVRNVGGVVSVAIYLAVLRNRLASTIPAMVPPALVKAGLPQSSIADFVAAISTGSFAKVPGVTAQIIDAGVLAYKQASVLAYRSVIYTCLAFLLLNFLCAFIFPNVDFKLTNEVAVNLHRPTVPFNSEKPKTMDGDHEAATGPVRAA